MYYIKKIQIDIIKLFLKIKNRKLADRYKSLSLSKLVTNKMKTIKWGVSYSVFDGIELLEESVKSIRNSVDYINVVYSNNSWHGEKNDEDIYSRLKILQNKKLIDEIIFYNVNPLKSHIKNEITKRNLGLKYAKKAKVNYFMTMDVDEFYVKNEVYQAKRHIIKNNITHSFCGIIWYSPLSTKRYIKPSNCAVQFFSKINRFSFLTKNKHLITNVDPTRILNHYIGAKYYFLNMVEMHHMSLIRKSLLKKMMSSGSRNYYMKRYQKFSSMSEYVESLFKDTITGPDIFNLKSIALKFLRDI